MEINEIMIFIGILLIGLFAALGKKITAYPRAFVTVLSLALIIQLSRGMLLSLVFFFSFLPLIFLQRDREKKRKKRKSSTVLEKFIAYAATLPLFGMAFVFREELYSLMKGWSFPSELIPTLEVGLILMTGFWTIEWTRLQKRRHHD